MIVLTYGVMKFSVEVLNRISFNYVGKWCQTWITLCVALG